MNISRVTIMGLGRLGGSLAAIEYFLKKGVLVHVTEKKEKEEFSDILESLEGEEGLTFHFGGHRKEDFEGSDIIVCSPAIPLDSEGVSLAKKYAPVYNDFSYVCSVYGERLSPYIAVTGTRGKTTTTQWISHILSSSFYGGNMPGRGFFWCAQRVEEERDPFVAEISSFQLEYMQKGLKAPHIALINNLFVDHLNRHHTMEAYALTKARIALFQNEDDYILLNQDDSWTPFFENLSFPGRHIYISLSPLPKGKVGLYVDEGFLWWSNGGSVSKVGRTPQFLGSWMLYNLLFALSASYLYMNSWDGLLEKVATLPQIPFRQEIVVDNGTYFVVNDSAATNPNAVIVAIEGFYSPGTALVIGGTDKDLNMSELARCINEGVEEEDIFLLEGSATSKLLSLLPSLESRVHSSLESIVEDVFKTHTRVVFSPGGSSFEKFKNEFDRGEQFNGFVRKYLNL